MIDKQTDRQTMDIKGGIAKRKILSRRSAFNSLTDDILLEILLRCPAKSLHRFNSVSKRWHSLISDPYFARSFIFGFGRHGETNNNNNILLLMKISHESPFVNQFYALPYANPSPSQPLTFDFLPLLSQSDYYSVNFKATYAGLVLVQGLFHNPAIPFCSRPNYLEYYVCNPVTKHWVQLLSMTEEGGCIGLASYYLRAPNSRIWADVTSFDDIINQNPDYNPNVIDFAVISIRVDAAAHMFIIHVFSSEADTPEWSIFRVRCPPEVDLTEHPVRGKVCFSNGKFHWLGDDCVVVYDPFSNPLECVMIPLPPIESLIPDDGYNVSFEAYHGHLRAVILFYRPRFLVLELMDYATKSWVVKYDVNLMGYHVNDIYIGEDSRCTYGGAVDDKVYFEDNDSSVMLFDFKNASLQHVYSCPIHRKQDFFFWFFEPFLLNPWLAPVPMLRHQRK